jgi:hypothetical protein
MRPSLQAYRTTEISPYDVLTGSQVKQREEENIDLPQLAARPNEFNMA